MLVRRIGKSHKVALTSRCTRTRHRSAIAARRSTNRRRRSRAGGGSWLATEALPILRCPLLSSLPSSVACSATTFQMRRYKVITCSAFNSQMRRYHASRAALSSFKCVRAFICSNAVVGARPSASQPRCRLESRGHLARSRGGAASVGGAGEETAESGAQGHK